MKAKKVYIAGKITGDGNFKEKFARKEAELKRKGYVVLNPATLPAGFEYEEYMHICFAMIDMCDYMCMLRGYEKSPGAMREHAYATGKKMPFLY
jgi:hypothetical protein